MFAHLWLEDSEMKSFRVVFVVLLGVLALGSGQADAQGGADDACPVLVETALQMVADSCTDLGRDEACYGHSRVDATFWDEQADFAFSQPSDRVALIDLQSITTHPLDVEAETWGIAALHVQADVPDTLPGQAVTFLLMGDATLENAVPPEQAAQPVEPVAATASMGANLRSRPSTNANVVSSVPAGAGLSLIGVNTAGDWYQVALEDGGTAWVWADLIVAEDNDALAALPIRDATAPAYGPMQAVYFSTGLGDPACNEAPNALVVQSPAGVEVTLSINDLEVTLSSTIVLALSTTQTDTGPVTVMVIALLEGHLEFVLNDQVVALDQPAAAPDTVPVVALTLNNDGRVDETSRVIAVSAEAIAPAVQSSCMIAYHFGVLGALSADVCSASPASQPAPPNDLSAGNGPLAGIGPGDPCTIAAINTVNQRSGPGTNYNRVGQLAAGQTAHPVGYATGTDGHRWWQLESGSWVWGDLVQSAGDCQAIPFVEELPTPPETLPASEAPTGGQGTGDTRPHYSLNGCDRHVPGLGIPVSEPIHAGENVHFHMCHPMNPGDSQDAFAGQTGTITVDGVSLSIYTIFDICGFSVKSDEWIATAGTHTIVGTMTTGESNTCVLTVVP
jgi:uncharacterized protein YgiM (DUF1202 family)